MHIHEKFFSPHKWQPKGFFNNTRGLRQADLLSMCLFVLGMEVFLVLMKKAVGEGLISKYKFSNRRGEES